MKYQIKGKKIIANKDGLISTMDLQKLDRASSELEGNVLKSEDYLETYRSSSSTSTGK